MTEAFEDRINSCDISIFQVESQSTDKDKASFLKIQKFIRQSYDNFCYLEVGSHLGGSILPYLLDNKCSSIISVDPRPHTFHDERGILIYNDNSTQRMIETLALAGGQVSLAKLKTIESDISSVRQGQIGSNLRVSLIDAEHTNEAVFRDFVAVYNMTEMDSLIALHDSALLIDGCRNIETFLRYLNVHHKVFYLPDNVFLVAFGSLAERAAEIFDPIAFDSEKFYVTGKQFGRDLIARALSNDVDSLSKRIEEQDLIINDLRKHSSSLENLLALTTADLQRHQHQLALTTAELQRHQHQLALTTAELQRHQHQLALTAADLQRHQHQLALTAAELQNLQRVHIETQHDIRPSNRWLAAVAGVYRKLVEKMLVR